MPYEYIGPSFETILTEEGNKLLEDHNSDHGVLCHLALDITDNAGRRHSCYVTAVRVTPLALHQDIEIEWRIRDHNLFSDQFILTRHQIMEGRCIRSWESLPDGRVQANLCARVNADPEPVVLKTPPTKPMPINSTRIDSTGGKFIVLADYGSEGIAVHIQSDDINEAVQESVQVACDRVAIVQLVDVRKECLKG
jgi:hypothetical protein